MKYIAFPTFEKRMKKSVSFFFCKGILKCPFYAILKIPNFVLEVFGGWRSLFFFVQKLILQPMKRIHLNKKPTVQYKTTDV